MSKSSTPSVTAKSANKHARLFARVYARLAPTSAPTTVLLGKTARLVQFCTDANPEELLQDLKDHMSDLGLPQMKWGKEETGWSVDVQTSGDASSVSVFVQV